MDHAQMTSTNAVTGSASFCNTPVMIMTTVETSQMSLAVVSNQEPASNDDDLQKENRSLNNWGQLVKNTSVFKKNILLNFVSQLIRIFCSDDGLIQ